MAEKIISPAVFTNEIGRPDVLPSVADIGLPFSQSTNHKGPAGNPNRCNIIF